MEHDEVRGQVAARLEQSGAVSVITDELCRSLLADKPEAMTLDEFFHLVALALLGLVRTKLVASCEPERLIGPLDRRQQVDYDRILHGLLLSLERDLLRSHLNMIRALGGAIAERDTGTNEHNYRVTIYAVRLAEAMDLGREQIRSLMKGSFLHDIGKIGIPDAILVKPAGLTAEEREIIKSHVERGANIVTVVNWLADAIDVIRYHHEHWDGTGYQLGLAGTEIPVTARIFTVGDVFDALTSRRPYKDAIGFKQAREMVLAGAGSKFDPEITAVFAEKAEEFYSYTHEVHCEHPEEIIRGFVREYFGFDWERSLLPEMCE